MSPDRETLITGIKSDIDAICCIYGTVGEAMYDEPRTRLAERISTRLYTQANEPSQPAPAESDADAEWLRSLVRNSDPSDAHDWHTIQMSPESSGRLRSIAGRIERLEAENARLESKRAAWEAVAGSLAIAVVESAQALGPREGVIADALGQYMDLIHPAPQESPCQN